MPERTTPDELFKAHQHLAGNIGESFQIPGLSRDACLNEALIALQKAVHRYDPSMGPFEPFGRTVINNHLKNEYNKAAKDRSRETTTLDQATCATEETLSPKDAIEDTAASPALEAERNDIRAALRLGLADLSPTQKRALELFAVGKSYAEISRETGVTLQAVRQAIERATAQMRPFLASRGIGCAKFLPQCHPENGVNPVSLNDLYPEVSPQKSNLGCTIILMVFALLWLIVWLIQ